MFCHKLHILFTYMTTKGSSCRDHMVVGFMTTYVISAYHHKRCVFESRSWRSVIKLVGDFWQVGCFLRFPPPIKLTVTI